MENNSRIDDFYNDLVQSGFTFGGKTDRASYDAMMADDARSKKLYGILTDRGWDLDDYDTWRNGFSSQSQPGTATQQTDNAPQGGGVGGNEFASQQLDSNNNPYQTAQTTQQVQQPMNTSRLDPKYQLNEDGNVKPFNVLEQEKTVDDNGNAQWKPKLVKGADGTDVYRNAMSGEEYNPLSPEAMENVAQNTKDPHQYEEKTNDPTWGETLGKSLGAGFTRAGAGLVDVMSQLTSGMYVDSGDGYIRTQSYEERIKDKNNPLTKASDVMHATADRMSQEAQPYGGQKGFLDLLWDGEIGKFAQKGLATAGESLPMTLSAYNPYTMVLNAISMAGGNYRDETLENPEIPAWKRATYAVGQAAIEQAVEKYADPVFKYIGGSKGKDVAEDVTKEATESIAKRIYSMAKDAAGEGAEEVITNFGNDALGEALDVLEGGGRDYGIRAQWEKMKKENPDANLSDFAMAKAKENVEAFIGGALAGAYTSGSAQLSSAALGYAVNHDSNEKVPDGVKLDPVTVEVAHSFDDGYKFEIPQEKNDAKIMYDVQRERMNGIVDEDTLNDIGNDPMGWIVENKGNLDADDMQTVLDYVNAKATYDGMIQKVRDDIDSQCAAFDKLIDSRTNRAGANAGMLVPATMKKDDRQVFVIDGDIRMLEDGSMVDASKSSESILVCDAETGKLDFVSPHDVMNVGEAVNAEEEKARVREDTTRQIAQEQANQMEGVLPFNVGDEYALVDDKGEKHTVKVIANSADPTNPEVALVSWDGGAPMPAPKEEIQKWSQQESRGRAEEKVAQKTVENAAANGAEVNGEAVAQPAVEAVAQPVAPVTGTAEGVQNTAENVLNGGENVQQTGENVQSEPMPMIGEGDDEEPDFLATTPERGLSFLFGESQWDESDADDFLNSNVKASAKEVEKIEGKRPKAGTNFAKFNKDMAAWNASKQEAEAKAKYWKQMKELRDAELAKQKAERDAAEKARQEAATDQAIAEEEAYAAEQAQKAAAQAELGSNNVAPAIRDKWNNAQKTVGSADEIVLANGEKITGHYVLVESGVASPSHNANNGFTKTEGFPVDENGNSVNDRDYERDQDAQRITRDIASRYDSRALQTPVVVSQDGVVLSGNGRTMAGEIAAADGTDGAYNQYVKDRAAKYGFTTEQVEKMQHPRVVFVLDASLPYTAETFAKFNQQEMKGQNKTEQAVKLGKVVDDATFGRIISLINKFETLNEFYGDASAATEAVTELQKAGVISEAQVTEMYDGDGISNIGRDLLENMLIGKAFESNPDAIRQISAFKSMRQTIIMALNEISNNIKLGEDFSLENELAAAIDLVYKARKEGGYKDGEKVSGFARQMNLGFYGDEMTVADMNNVTALILADLINDKKTSLLRNTLSDYNAESADAAAGQMDLFSGGVRSKEDILKDLISRFNYGTEQAKTNTRTESAPEAGTAQQVGTESQAGNGGSGNSETAPERQGGLGEGEGVSTSTYGLSDEKDENGKSFVTTKDGSTEFGVIEGVEGLTDAPIKLSIGENIVDSDGLNHGYGLTHIVAHEGREDKIKEAGYDSVEDFVEAVAKNYNTIREGNVVANNQTYLLELTDEHNNTLFIQLSKDGSYWNVNSAGVFRVNYSRNKRVVNTVPALGSSASTDATGVDHGTTKGAAIASGNSPIDSQGKVSNNSATKQTQVDETDIFSQNEAETESADGNSSPVATAIAAAEAETDTNPSEAQKEAGNYKKGHVKVDGYDITIENPKGSVRSGKDADGKEWSVTMNNTYGYIRGTEGVDGDHIDVFLSDNPEQGNVYVVDQVDADGNFDEHKVMYGFGSAEEARDNYLANYSDGWKMGTITEVSKEEFKKWIESSHRKTKPFSEYKSVKKEGAQGEAQHPSTAAEEKETNVDKAIRIMKEIDDLSSELDELYTTGPEAEADRVSAEHMAKYGELEALEKSMTDEEKEALDKRLRDEVDDLDGEWAEWLEAGMKEEPVESTHSLNNAEAEKNQKPEKPEKPQKTSQRKPRKTKPSTTTAGDEKINDVGEKIGGARKDATLNYAKKIDLEATVPSKIFPKPNFASMEKAGVPHETLVKLKAYYTAFSITNKNKRKRNENQRILSARFYASVARDMLLRDVDVFNESADGIVLTDYGKQHLELLVSCVEALDKKGMQDFFDLDISDVDITIGEFKENENGAYQTKDGKRWVGTYSYGRTNNMAAVRYKLFALDDIEGLAEEYCKQVEEAHSKNVQNEIKMHVYRMSSGKCYISAKVKGIADEIKLKDGFATSKEAFDYIRENGDALRTEARAKADEMKQSKKNGGGTRKPTNDDIERMLRNIVQGTRIGKDYRNGKDVSAEDFMKEFGFRGVEFGNWATQKERQDHLNACYDALMDLADLIGISPKAISLGGKLAMAFGSRGHSSALAHYEPAKHVINLTKEHGAGCVAHEWFHAIDNYFGGGVFGLRMKSAVEGNSRDNLRNEMQKIFAEIGRALNGSDMKVRSKKLGNGDYWASTLEMAARAFESYVNERLMARGQMNQYLSAHVPGEAVQYEALAKNDPYPTAEESKKFGEIFDRLFDTVQEEVGDDGNVNLFQIADVEPGTENVTEAQQLATEAIITALGENAGLDVVMESQENGQRVAAEQNADTEMMALSNNEQEFDSMKKMAHDEKGHVLPGLAEKTVTVVPLSDHGFGETFGEAVKNAKEWAKSNLAGKEYDFPEGGKYVISNKAIGKYLSSSAFTKSDNSNVHLAALRMLPEIIGNSMDAEIHEDYKKGEDGKRNVNNGVENENKLVHRLYGAVTLGDKTYRVKTTMYEYRDGELKNNTPHSYEITEIELLDSPVLPAEAVKNTIGISNNSISGANLLKNVEKSYDNGVKILENQQNTAEFMQVWHGSAAVFDYFDGAFMGSGEGSQVYGDGHYVTGVESTGRMYATIATENRQRSNTPIVRWKGQQVDFSSVNPLRLAHDVADSSRTIKEARERAERYADMAEEQDMKTNWALALDILKQSTKADFKPVPVNGNRQLYEVEIPDDNGKNYLDWNDAVSVSDQNKIEELLFAEVVNDKESDYTEKDRKQFHDDMGFGNKNLSVGDLYGTMTFALGSKKAASALLRKAGFVGIKVPTGNRRGGDGRGTNYVIFDDNDLKITDRVQFMQRPEGTVYGWSEGNRIHLTPEGINPNTPIHEYTHLWARAVMQKNPKLWNRIKELLQGTPIWEEVVNDPAYQGLTTDDAIASEALSRLSGRKNAGKMEKMAQDLLNEAKGNGVFAEANAHNLILKMKQALKDFWKCVGVNLFDMTDVKNIDEVTDRVLYDMLNKTDLALSEDGDVATEFQVVTDDQINTPQFKKWFGDWENDPEHSSKVVDAEGKPLVVYHGTQLMEMYFKEGRPYTKYSERFNTFNDGKGFFTSDKDAAESFARGKQGLYETYLNIRNPYVIDCNGKDWDAIEGYENPEGYTTVSTDYIVNDIKRNHPEYDGVIFKNVMNENNGVVGYPIDDYVPFKASQIKSATENNGEFDAENPDIRFRERTEFDDGEVIDIVGNRGSQDYSLADSTMPSYKTKEELLHAFQEKNPAYAAALTADGNGIEVTAWKNVLDERVRKPRRRNGEPTKAEKQRAAYVERKTQIAIDMVNEKAQKLGLNVEVITDTEGLPKNMADKKGWYNKVTGKITIVLPNHSNGQDVMRTLMHEGVAHHGLRQMFGEDFDTFLNNVYANADIDVRRRIAELAAKKGWDFHTATEEYLAALAEDIDFEKKVDQNWWKKVRNFFVDMLRKAGIVLDDKLTDNDLRYIVWKSYERMAYAGDHGAIRDARTVMMDQQLGTGNFGTRAVADGSRVADGSELLYRDGEDEAEDSAPLSMNESMIQGLITLAEKNKENAAYKTYVVKAIGGELAKLRKAMSAQKEYDRSTVEQMTGLARLLIKNGMLGNMSEQEMMKLLTTIKNATGRNDITKYAQQIYDLMIKNQLEQARNMLDQVTRIKDSKVNAQGVEVQGQLDVRGQNMIKAFRKAMQLDEANINELLQNASDRMDSPDAAVADEAATEYAALTLAMQYVHEIKDSVADERVAKEELAQARKDHAAKTDGLSAKAFKEYVQEAEDAIRQKQLERIEAFHNLAARLAGAMQGSIESAKKFRERELERVKNIHHFANSDMQGRPANAHRVDNWKQKVMNNPFLRFLFNPLGTFDQMLRMIGSKSVNGEGYLYNHFMRGWLDATQKEFENYHAACKVLDDKVREVFGKKMRWSDLYAEERKMPKAEITFVDVDGSERTVELNQGNLLYIYMANKMADGRMKLRAMGIMEDDIENIKQVLDPRFIKLADWLQEEFLVNKRNDYNAVHERMFGAPMAAIENYFPLRILGDARVQQVDVAEDKIEKELPSILTGSIIKRKTNKNPLDVMNTDAFSVVVEHLQQMEKWAAFAEWRRDLNTLLSYKRFRNQLKNMSSVYGAGNTLWRNFMIAGSIAAGTHRPKVDYDGVDTTLVNVAKGVTTAKIAFRVFTAIKQLLSAPAFMAESSLLNLGKSIATPWKSWNWAMEELPTFKKRWQSKQAGDSRLMKTDVDWRFWKNRLVDTLSRWGMSPNAFVDAMTVAIGGRAIYETKRARYIEDGYSEAEADKKAKQDAAVLVNQTQQSSETAFVSKMQLDRTVAAVSLSVFRNSSMAYQRQLVDSLRGLKRMATPGYKEESIDFMAKQMVRDGLDEDAAKRAATRAYNREWVRNLSRTALFGFGMQMAWNLGAYLPYLIFGDDDDEKKEMLEDAAMHGLFGSIEGLSGGNLISELGNMKVKGESFRNYDMDLLPLMSEIKNIYTKFESDEIAAVNDMVNLLIQSGFGVNPQTITDAIVAITDACNGDVDTGREATILFLRLAQAPQSQIDKLYIDELGMRGDEASKLSVQQLAERYADYKKKRGAPLMQWAYSDEQEKAVEDKYIKKYEKQAKERLMQTTGDAKLDDAFEAYEENYKDVKKRLEAVNKLKDEDFTEFYTRMGELASTPEFTKYNTFKGYKTAIDNLMKAALDAKSADDREGYLMMIDDRKRELVDRLDAMK